MDISATIHAVIQNGTRESTAESKKIQSSIELQLEIELKDEERKRLEKERKAKSPAKTPKKRNSKEKKNTIRGIRWKLYRIVRHDKNNFKIFPLFQRTYTLLNRAKEVIYSTYRTLKATFLFFLNTSILIKSDQSKFLNHVYLVN